jgi:hypothetical protein
MKGIVFTEFVEMVETRFSPEMADDLLDTTPLESGGAYTAVGTYDHRELVAMVLNLSERTGVPVPALVKTFGQHLFGRFHILYPVFFEGVSDALEFLSRIEDVIHVEVRKLYPDAELPRFDISRPAHDQLVMIYRSDRHMGDLAEGMIEACIEHYGEPVTLVREVVPDDASAIRFALKKVA